MRVRRGYDAALYDPYSRRPLWTASRRCGRRGRWRHANAHGLPLWNADDWLNFTETRHDANDTDVAWNNGARNPDLQVATATAGLTLTTILPITYSGLGLQSVTVDGQSHSFSLQTVNGIGVAFVSVPAGDHSFIAVHHVVTPTPTILRLSPRTSTRTATPHPQLLKAHTYTATFTPTPSRRRRTHSTFTPMPSATPTVHIDVYAYTYRQQYAQKKKNKNKNKKKKKKTLPFLPLWTEGVNVE